MVPRFSPERLDETSDLLVMGCFRGQWRIRIVGGIGRVTALHDDANDVDEFSVRLNPQAGYLVAARIALSATLQLGYSTQDQSGRIVEVGGGPGISYYWPLSKSFMPFATVRAMIVRPFSTRAAMPLLFPKRTPRLVLASRHRSSALRFA